MTTSENEVETYVRFDFFCLYLFLASSLDFGLKLTSIFDSHGESPIENPEEIPQSWKSFALLSPVMLDIEIDDKLGTTFTDNAAGSSREGGRPMFFSS